MCALKRLLVFPSLLSLSYVAADASVVCFNKKNIFMRDARATPLLCRQWSNQILLACGALLAVHDGLRFAGRVCGRFLRSAVSLFFNSILYACTAILRLVH